MYAWAVRTMIRRAVDRMNAGDLRPTLRSYADDAVLVFPGEHSWAAQYRGKDEIARFFRRAVAAGLKFEFGDIVVKGPPWNTTVCLRFADRAADDAGNIVYANRVMEFVKARWGKIVYQELYLDTQKVAEFDRHLGLHEPAGA